MMDLGAFLAAAGEDGGPPALQQPARACATQILAAWHARVLRRGRRLERRSSDELHRLRIAVKQLRYAVEFFSGLYAPRRMAALRNRLTLLQDILGRINDASGVAALVGSAAATGDRDVQTAADMVIDCCEARAATERALLKPAWRRFRAAPQPWRE